MVESATFIGNNSDDAKNRIMFKFLHTADLHLDSPLRGLRKREEASVETILGATRRAFEKLIDLALDEEVDFMVIAGDVYDRDWKGYETGLFFRKQMLRLDGAGIPVFLISGNHDAASVITRKLTLPGNVREFSSRSPDTKELEGLPVALHGMSFPNRAVSENLVPRYPDPVRGKFNIGILHTSLAGSEGHDAYAPCKPEELAGKGYDYWALGHVHQPQIVSEDPWIVYPGCIQGRSVKECGERGCRIVRVGDSFETGCDWHVLDEVRWARALVDVGGAESIGEVVDLVREGIGREVEAADGRLLAVRVELTGVSRLHGEMHAQPERLEAEIAGVAEEFGDEAVWIERVRIKTKARTSLEELARRDELTKLVIEAVREGEESAERPGEVEDMLKVLPGELKSELEAEWTGEGQRELYEDACMMVLEELKTKGGEQ